MAITKDQKKKIIADLTDKISRQKVMVFADFTGTKAKDLLDLRKKIKSDGGDMKVAKKTLGQLALAAQKLDAGIKELKGEIAFIFGFQDEISPAKNAWQFSEKNQNFRIVGGILENSFIGAEKVIELAKLPSREDLLAKLLGAASAPVSNFVYALSYNLKGLMQVLSKIKS